MSDGSPFSQRLQWTAPAKINLHLRVGPLRPDGFHPLLSWMATIDLCDTLTLCPDRSEQTDAAPSVRLSCSDPSLPVDQRNLVVRAAALLNHRLTTLATGGFAEAAAEGLGKTHRPPTPRGRPAALHLEKRVPAGGGLGGGSSDAATALRALNHFWNAGLSIDELATLAAQLGSDIPFFLFGPSSVVRGRGERIEPIGPPLAPKWVALFLPSISMPTPDVYRQFDKMNLGRESDITVAPDWRRWLALPSAELLPNLVNDLEPPAFALRPELARLRDNLEQSLARPVRMSGSGSSLFTLYDDKNAAESASAAAATSDVRALPVQLCPLIAW